MEKSALFQAYKNSVLEHGKRPASVYAFCKEIQYNEQAYYNEFNSLDVLEKEIWLSFFQDTVMQLEADETYQNYSAREKLLAFYFSWIQTLKENRSYILVLRDMFTVSDLMKDRLELFRLAFEDYATNIVKSGYETREIKERKFISDQYAKGLWLQALFVLKYWVDDTSKGFEMTDAAIEKSVDLSFNLISSNTLDSLIDFGKFMLVKK
jgi:hypothetical protein